MLLAWMWLLRGPKSRFVRMWNLGKSGLWKLCIQIFVRMRNPENPDVENWGIRNCPGAEPGELRISSSAKLGFVRMWNLQKSGCPDMLLWGFRICPDAKCGEIRMSKFCFGAKPGFVLSGIVLARRATRRCRNPEFPDFVVRMRTPDLSGCRQLWNPLLVRIRISKNQICPDSF